MSTRLCVLLACTMFAHPATASGRVLPQALLDSARVAREAWRDGTLAARRGELALARASLRRAMQARPAQPAYGSATLPSRRAASTPPAWWRHSSGSPISAAATTSPPRWTGAWFLGSVRHGKIVRVLPGGASDVLVPARQDGLWGVFGLRVDTAANTLWVTRHVRELSAPPRSTTLGIDGLAWEDGSLLAIQNGITPARVVRVRLDAARTRIAGIDVLDGQPLLADEPTMGLVHDGAFYYVGNSQWEKYDRAGRVTEGARLAGPRILVLPLR